MFIYKYSKHISKIILELYYKNRYGFIYKIENIIIPSIKSHILNIGKAITLFYLFSTIISLLKFFYELIKNPKRKFIHFDYHMFLVAPFYWVRYLNIKKFGKYGTSNLMGVGNHDLSQYWYYTKLSLFLFYKNGALFQVYSGLLLATSIIYCSDLTSPLNFVILLIFFSSKFFHYFIFVSQNYNAIGWSIVPLYIYFINTYEHLMASVALLAISFLSFTAAVCLTFISIGFSLEQNSWLPILYSIPCIFKILTHILPNLLNNNFISIKKVASAIGLRSNNIIYKRSKSRLPTLHIYLLVSVSCYLLIHYSYLSYVLIAVLLLAVLNFTKARFADFQTFDFLITIFLTTTFIQNNFCSLADFIILLTSSNILIFKVNNDTFIKRGISSNSLCNNISSFLSNIPSKSKIYFKFNDPNGCYEKCFEGQRFLLDYLTLESLNKEILFFPDFSAVFDNNCDHTLSLWADSPKQTIDQLSRYNTKYCICHQPNGTSLNSVWLENGFKLISTFDWMDFIKENKFDKNLWFYGNPKWFLLEKC